jgi:SAM-dependent methyltransferase
MMADESPGDAREPVADARARLVAHLDRLDRRGSTRASGRTTLRRLLPPQLRIRLRVAATHARERAERDRAARLAGDEPLWLHLGSADVAKPGWVNVDLAGDAVDLRWDLTRPLPFATGAVDAVFHEHFVSVLGLREGLALTEECHRVLRAGGVLRCGVPDCGDPREAWPDAPTALLGLQEFFHWDASSRTMYDRETLALLLKAAGFASPEARPFGESLLDPCPDSPHRRRGTLFMEAVKEGTPSAT